MSLTNKLAYNQPNLSWERMHSWLETILQRASHFHLVISRVGANHYTPSTVSRDHFQICANRAYTRSPIDLLTNTDSEEDL